VSRTCGLAISTSVLAAGHGVVMTHQLADNSKEYLGKLKFFFYKRLKILSQDS